MSYVIDADGVSKTYATGRHEVAALVNVSLKVNKGDFVSIMGQSGSGKSTLLNVIGCLDTPTGGTLSLDGVGIKGLGDEELSRIRGAKIGFVFQTFNLIPQLNAYENVELPLLYGRFGETEVKEKAMAALDSVGLSHRFDHKPSELSGGESQRVAIARALVVNPSIILADEPTGNLDSVTGEVILELFEKLNSQGATIVMATHDKAIARRSSRPFTITDGSMGEG